MWEQGVLAARDLLWGHCIGCGLCILGNLAIALGLNIQKLSLAHDESLPAKERRAPLFQKQWFLGFVVLIIGNLLNFVSLGLTPLSIVAPLNVSSIIGNVIFATLLIGEVFTLRDFGSTVMISVGTVITVYYGSHEQVQSVAPDELWHLLIQPAFLIFMGVMLVLGCAVFFHNATLQKKGSQIWEGRSINNPVCLCRDH